MSFAIDRQEIIDFITDINRLVKLFNVGELNNDSPEFKALSRVINYYKKTKETLMETDSQPDTPSDKSDDALSEDLEFNSDDDNYDDSDYQDCWASLNSASSLNRRAMGLPSRVEYDAPSTEIPRKSGWNSDEAITTSSDDDSPLRFKDLSDQKWRSHVGSEGSSQSKKIDRVVKDLFETDGPIAPFGTDGPMAPFGTDGPIAPFGTDGPIAPFGTDGPRAPFRTDGPRAPFGTDGPRASFDQPPYSNTSSADWPGSISWRGMNQTSVTDSLNEYSKRLNDIYWMRKGGSNWYGQSSLSRESFCLNRIDRTEVNDESLPVSIDVNPEILEKSETSNHTYIDDQISVVIA